MATHLRGIAAILGGVAATLATLVVTPLHAAPAAFAGPATTVMVLGTPHLSGMAKTLQPAWLTPLLDRLAATRPDLIVIEAISGEQCDQLRRFDALYAGAAEGYCASVEVAVRSVGLEQPAATVEVQKTLAAWPASPTPAQRRHLAALFAASGDRASALVQWLRLPEGERHEGDGIDAPLAGLMGETLAKFNENTALAAVLAARLGHERVYPVDDHTADAIQAARQTEIEASLGRIWNSPAAAQLGGEMGKRSAAIRSGADLLAHYRWMNLPSTQKAFEDVDQAAAARDNTPPYLGRHYLAWWEARNLRMVASIRVAAGNQPGARVLAIVGSSHKRPYERYLAMMTDIQVQNVAPVLRP